MTGVNSGVVVSYFRAETETDSTVDGGVTLQGRDDENQRKGFGNVYDTIKTIGPGGAGAAYTETLR